MRGKDFVAPDTFPIRRITPAYAGKSSMHTPRIFEAVGSPPPMRGKVGMHDDLLQNGGITPAYAGKRYSQNQLIISK